MVPQLIKHLEDALAVGERERKLAVRHQSINAYHLALTKCDNGEVPQGMVELVESLSLLEGIGAEVRRLLVSTGRHSSSGE